MKAGKAYSQRVLKPFRSRNYRLFFFGQGLSLVGSWMTRVATGWLVYRLTGSPLLLGLVGFAGQIPIFFLAPFAGVWVDRMNRRRVLVVTQIGRVHGGGVNFGIAQAGKKGFPAWAE